MSNIEISHKLKVHCRRCGKPHEIKIHTKKGAQPVIDNIYCYCTEHIAGMEDGGCWISFHSLADLLITEKEVK